MDLDNVQQPIESSSRRAIEEAASILADLNREPPIEMVLSSENNTEQAKSITGIEPGYEAGIAWGTKFVINRLLANNWKPDYISKILGMPLHEIDAQIFQTNQDCQASEWRFSDSELLGIHTAKSKIAIKLIKNGYLFERVSEFTDLPLSELTDSNFEGPKLWEWNGEYYTSARLAVAALVDDYPKDETLAYDVRVGIAADYVNEVQRMNILNGSEVYHTNRMRPDAWDILATPKQRPLPDGQVWPAVWLSEIPLYLISTVFEPTTDIPRTGGNVRFVDPSTDYSLLESLRLIGTSAPWPW